MKTVKRYYRTSSTYGERHSVEVEVKLFENLDEAHRFMSDADILNTLNSSLSHGQVVQSRGGVPVDVNEAISRSPTDHGELIDQVDPGNSNW